MLSKVIWGRNRNPCPNPFFDVVRYEMFQNFCKECPEPAVPLHLSGKTIGRILDDGLAKQIYKAMLPPDIGSVSSKPTEQGQTDAQRR